MAGRPDSKALRRAPVARDLPPESGLIAQLPRIDYLDSFEIALERKDLHIVALYAAVLDHLPAAFKSLLVARSHLVAPLGLKGPSRADLDARIDTDAIYAPGDRIGRWRVFAAGKDELITGANDHHLDFRVSVLRRDGPARLALSTAILTHNALGRAYLAAVRPFHRLGVMQLLTRAAAAGRI
jgi:hypothetical protein